MKFFKKLANGIVKLRWVLFALFIILTVVSAILIPKVGINYDMTKYLPDSSSTKVSLSVMEDEFGASGTASVMVTGASDEQLNEIIDKLENVENVENVIFDKSKEEYYKDNNALIKIFFSTGNYDVLTADAINNIREVCEGLEVNLSGQAVDATASRTSISSEMTTILLIAILIVLVILTFTSRSWLEPLVYLIVIGCAIVINMGTNLILGEISFITQSISAIMLIALEMDYCIVLCSRYREEESKGLEPVEAMKSALANSFTAIIASSCTVMAGLIALMFMDFSIGFDIGAVLAKGVFISILAVLFFMPSVLLILSKLISKTKHRSFLPKMDKIGTFASKMKVVFPVIFVCIIIVGVFLQTGVSFNYVNNSAKAGSQLQVERTAITDVFGTQNSLVVMVSNNNKEEEKALYNEICNIKLDNDDTLYINSSSSIVDTALYTSLNASQLKQLYGLDDPTIAYMFATYEKNVSSDTLYGIQVINFLYNNIDSITNENLKAKIIALNEEKLYAESLFCGEDFDRLIFNINLDVQDEKARLFIDKLNEVLSSSSFDTYYVANETCNLIETEQVFSTDRLRTDLLTIILVFLIVFVAFRSFSIPVILVLTIQGSIWINMAISAVAGESIFFVCYLLAMAIQMGATIDYGILLTDRYINFRRTNGKETSIKKALNASIATILTSGLILICAAFTIHFVSSIDLISTIGLLIGRGALISVLAIIFILPELLLLFDKVIEKTSFEKGKPRKFYNEIVLTKDEIKEVSEKEVIVEDNENNSDIKENANESEEISMQKSSENIKEKDKEKADNNKKEKDDKNFKNSKNSQKSKSKKKK